MVIVPLALHSEERILQVYRVRPGCTQVGSQLPTCCAKETTSKYMDAFFTPFFGDSVAWISIRDGHVRWLTVRDQSPPLPTPICLGAQRADIYYLTKL